MSLPESRMAKARELMKASGLDALMVLSQENRHYLSGFTAEDHQCDETAAALLITDDQHALITDSRFELQAKSEAADWDVIIYRNTMMKQLATLSARFGLTKVGYESQRISMQQLRDLEMEIAKSDDRIKMEPVADLGKSLRQIKDQQEIELTYQALRIAESVFQHVVRNLRPGMTEKKIAWEMEKGMREAGADALSFPVIVASGPNSALPHAVPSDRQIENGEPILFDWGCKLNGYCSDTSRTVVLGTPDETFLKVYHCVLEAQQKAIDLIKAGANSKDVDAAARNHIHSQGFTGKFGHGLGHGTGLAVHETPRLSPLIESELAAGMIVTVEPGIYLPAWGGVRIEHQVVVRPDKAEVMNTLSTSFDISRI